MPNPQPAQSTVVYRCIVHGLVEATEEYKAWESEEVQHMCPVHTGHDDLCFMELDGPIKVQEVE